MVGFFDRLLGRKPDAPLPPSEGDEHAVLIHVMLAGTSPTEAEMAISHALQDELIEAVEASRSGMLDGDEWGGGECTIYMYGRNADTLWTTIEPVMQRHVFPRGSYVEKRYGGPESSSIARIDLASPS